MEKSEKIIKKIIHLAAFISGICIFLTMLMTMWDIIGRRFFSSSVPGVYELSSLGLVVISFLAMGYPQIEGENVGVTMLYDRMKPKVKAAMDFGVSIICIALFSVVVKQTITFALRMTNSNQITPVLHIPLQPFVYITTLGIVILILGFILDLLKSIRDFKGDRLDV